MCIEKIINIIKFYKKLKIQAATSTLFADKIVATTKHAREKYDDQKYEMGFKE